MELINNRYQLKQVLSSDLLGTVWHAVDLHHDQPVRLCVLSLESCSSEYGQDLMHRYIEMASVTHENLLTAYSLDRIHNLDNRIHPVSQYFYTSEYYDDSECISYLDLTEAETVAVIRQLCYGLNYIHFRGYAYKYLNFGNVLLFRTEAGIQVRLKELPTVLHYREQLGAYSSDVEQFLSPETVQGSQANAASDMYSLGVMLYYLILKLPFESNRFENFKKEAMTNDAQRLVERMTFTNPAERLGTIQEFVEAAHSVLNMDFPFTDRHRYERLQTGILMVGRRKETERILDIIRKRMDLKTDIRAVLIQGESGIGKSRLMQELHYLINMGAFPCIQIGVPFQHTQGHFVFANILREIIRNQIISPELIKKYGAEVVKILPEMRDVWKVAPTDPLADEAERMRINNRVYSFVLEHVQSNPLVVLIDNIGDMSRQDFSVLEYLINTQRKLPLLFVLSVRDESAPRYPRIGSWIQNGQCEVIALNKFGFTETVEMIQRILGIGEAPFSLAARLMTDAAGNPKAISEAIKTLFMYEYLRIEENRRWSDPSEAIGDLELSVSAEDHTEQELMFEPECRKVLDCISVFDSPAPQEVLEPMVGAYRDQIADILDRMVASRVLNRKLGDWGNTFDFYNKRLRKRILSEIPSATRLEYHRIAAESLEACCSQQNAPFMESLIHHLNGSLQLEKAAHYAQQLAKRMVQMNHNRQALEFYTMALRLRQDLKTNDLVPSLMSALGDVHLRLNDSDKALQMFDQAAELAREQGQFKSWAEARIRSRSIRVRMKDFGNFAEEYDDLVRQCHENDYLEGALKAALTLSYIHLSFGRFDAMRALAESSLALARSGGMGDYIGLFLNEKGLCDMYTGRTSDAFVAFLESGTLLEKSENPQNAIYPCNNLGILSMDYLGDIERGREYFLRAVASAERMNVVWGMDMLYANLSESYIKEHDYDTALDYLHKAGKLAEDARHYDIQFSIYISLCQSYLARCQYDEAYRYLSKLDYEYRNRQGYALSSPAYFMCHIRFAVEMRNLEEALEWYHRAYEEPLDLPDNMEFVFRLQKLMIDHLRNNGHSHLSLESHLNTLIKVTTNPVEIRMIREVILDVALENLNKNQLVTVRNLLDLDQELIEGFDTLRLQTRRGMLSGVFESDQAAYYHGFMRHWNLEAAPVEHWHVHFVYGREMDAQKDAFNAILHYYYAMDALKSMALKVPEKYRDAFMLKDEMKVVLYRSLHLLVRRIIGGGRKADAEMDAMPMDSRHYFEMQDEDRILSNNRFLQVVYRQYGRQFGFQAGSFEELVGLFGPDEQQNILYILKYMTQITFADRGFLIFNKDIESIVDRIATEPEAPIPDLGRFASYMELESEGVLIRNADSKTLQLSRKKESLIVLPISYPQEKPTLPSRRRYENRNRVGKNLGYVILQSEKPFNNFTVKSFEQCRILARTMHAYVENYTLKHFSVIDRLTGTYLRKYMETRLMEEFERCKMQSQEISIIMADIDHFKNVNDVYGHQKGDEVLSNIGSLIRRSLRKGDFVGRYGGEEFMVVLPETSEIDAYKVCEKIRQMIEGALLLGDDTHLTMSFGIASFPTHGVMEEELIEKADQALYESKHMGRNRTTIWTSNIGVAKQRFDKLAGVLEGNISSDSRKIQAMVDILALIGRHIGWEGKLYDTLSILVDITEAQAGFLLRIQDGVIQRRFARSVGVDGFDRETHVPEAKVMQVLRNGYGDYFVDWENVRESQDESGIPDWNSYIIVPLVRNGDVCGAVVLSVPVSKKEFDFNTFNFVNTLGGVISVVLTEQEV